MSTDASPAKELADLETMNRQELLSQWEISIGGTAPIGLSESLMRRALAHHIQCAAYGDLPKKTRRALKDSVAPNSSRPARSVKTGARLVREWNGVLHVVDVVEDGFRYLDRSYRSLSAIATAITGAKWSGPRFFGLKARSDA